MDKVLIPKTTPDMESALTQIMSKAMGVPIIFDAAPSASDLLPDQWGVYGTNVYMKLSDGSTIKLTGASF